MSKKTMSIRGEIVDFDLFEIKKQILNSPKGEDTKNRERFIDKKRRRTSRNTIDQLIAQQKQNEASVREALAKKANDVEPELDVVESEVITEITPTTETRVNKIIKKK